MQISRASTVLGTWVPALTSRVPCPVSLPAKYQNMVSFVFLSFFLTEILQCVVHCFLFSTPSEPTLRIQYSVSRFCITVKHFVWRNACIDYWRAVKAPNAQRFHHEGCMFFFPVWHVWFSYNDKVFPFSKSLPLPPTHGWRQTEWNRRLIRENLFRNLDRTERQRDLQ